METLFALKDLLVQAIPTFVLVWILYWYSTHVFFRPLQKTLQKRHESTRGLRQAAEEKLALAERKTEEYQQALRAAWADLYRQQEQERQQALERRAEILGHARRQAEELVSRARQEIRDEAETAKKHLAAESEQIAASILHAILKPSPAGALSRPHGGPGAAP